MRVAQLATCFDCAVKHRVVGDIESPDFFEEWRRFAARHPEHRLALLPEAVLDIGAFRDNADVKQAFGTSTAMTCTLASLLDNTARESTAIDNTTNLFLDAFVYLAIPLQTGTPANEKATFVWAYGSEDGTNYTDNATGTDAAVTMRSPTNFRLAGIINMPAAGALTYKSHPMSIAAAFGGLMPRKWGIVVENQSGVTFNATEANLIKTYSGVYATVV